MLSRILFPADAELQQRDSATYELHNRFNSVSENLASYYGDRIFDSYSAFVNYIYGTFDPPLHDQDAALNCYLFMAVYSTLYNKEEEGMAFIEKASALQRAQLAENQRFIQFISAVLYKDRGVSRLANDLVGSVMDYFIALSEFVDLDLPYHVTDLLDRIKDLSTVSDAEVITQIGIGLAKHLNALDKAFGSLIWPKLIEICFYCHSKLSEIKGELNYDVLYLMTQFNKGRVFSYLMAMTSADALDQINLYENIYEKEPQLSQELLRADPLNEYQLLTFSYPEQYVPGGFSSNPKIDFDLLISYHLRRYAVQFAEQIPHLTQSGLSLTETKNCLDDRTALLLMNLTDWLENEHDIYTYVITRNNPTLLLMGKIDHAEWKANRDIPFYHSVVFATRENIVRDPPWSLFRTNFVHPAASTMLENLSNSLWGKPIKAAFAQHSITGIDSLIIVPHGPLHYLPMHLAGSQDHVMADDFKISYLPHLELLLTNRPRNFVPKMDQLLCIGLDYHESTLLPDLPETVAEAKSIAETWNGKILINENATRDKVIKALQFHKYIHIAAHGTMDADAPNFQRLFLHSPGEELNCLLAYDILQLDLRGVDLVTLSACETALGKYDLADNLLGLPASFFLSGVTTIIATLWPVETNCATYFFTELYRALKTGLSKFDAFCKAQEMTRKFFPQFRDWGTFYFMGQRQEERTKCEWYTISGMDERRFSKPFKNQGDFGITIFSEPYD